MIRNSNCAYCGVLLNNLENHENCASVEHMIPNSALRKKRKNDQGDFLVCRGCNLKKSRMDEIIGLFTRLTLDEDADDSVEKYIKRVNKNDKIFTKAITSLVNMNGEIGIRIPVTVKQAIEYFEYFGKGQFIICNKEVFNESTHIILVEIMGSSVVKAIENRYEKNNLSNPFDDLLQNKNEGISNVQGKTFIICSDDASDMFIFFNKALLIKINIRYKTRETITKKNKTRRFLNEVWEKS